MEALLSTPNIVLGVGFLFLIMMVSYSGWRAYRDHHQRNQDRLTTQKDLNAEPKFKGTDRAFDLELSAAVISENPRRRNASTSELQTKVEPVVDVASAIDSKELQDGKEKSVATANGDATKPTNEQSQIDGKTEAEQGRLDFRESVGKARPKPIRTEKRDSIVNGEDTSQDVFEHLTTVFVRDRMNYKSISGRQIKDFLTQKRLTFLDGRFHSYHTENSLQFSVVDYLAPGLFDYSQIDTLMTSGIAFVLDTRSTNSPEDAYLRMIQVAQQAAEQFGNQVRVIDSAGGTLCKQRIDHDLGKLRQQSWQARSKEVRSQQFAT